MSYIPGDGYSVQFTTSSPATGAATDADSLPAATADWDGSGTGAMTLTVVRLDTGRYKITGTIPGGRVRGDVLNVSVAATVGGVSGKAVVDTQVIDSRRVGDLNNAATLTDYQQRGVAVTLPANPPAGFLVTGSFATGAIDATAFAQGAADKVWGSATRVLTAGTNIALAKGTGITGLNDIAAASIWDLATVGHTTAGTFGAATNAAGSAGDPWATSLPGLYGTGTAGNLLGNRLDAAVSGVPTGVWAAGTRTLSAFGFSVIVGTNNDKSGYNLNLAQVIPISNTDQTVGDALNAARAQGFGAWDIVGSLLRLKAPDGTVVRTFTLNDATNPTSRT